MSIYPKVIEIIDDYVKKGKIILDSTKEATENIYVLIDIEPNDQGEGIFIMGNKNKKGLSYCGSFILEPYLREIDIEHIFEYEENENRNKSKLYYIVKDIKYEIKGLYIQNENIKYYIKRNY